MTGRSSKRGLLPVCLAFFALALFAAPTAAQRGPIPDAIEPETVDESPVRLEAQAKTEELRSRLEEWEAKSREYVTEGQEAEARIELIGREIAHLQQRGEIAIPEDVSVARLDALLLDAEQDLAAARRERMDLDAEAELRSERRRRIPELLSIAKQRLRGIEAAPSVAGSDQVPAELLAELDRLRRAVLAAEVEAYQNELESYDARGSLLSKRRDRATLRIAYSQTLIERLRASKQRLERLEVEQENEATKQLLDELTAAPPGFKETLEALYQRNEALASVWTSDGGLYDQIEDVSVKLSRAESKVAEVEAELARLAARVEAVGLADSVGVLLRSHRAEAPDIGMYRRFIRMRQEQIGSVQLQQIKLREQRQALADIDTLVDEAMASLEEPASEVARAELEPLLRQLFETQRKYMDALIEHYETYFQKLVDFDARQQELISRTKDLLAFIDERILWVPSGKVVQVELLSDGRDAAAWLLAPKYWAQVGRGARDALTHLWPVHVLAFLLALLFIPFARRARSRIEKLGAQAQREDCLGFAPTAEALGLSFLLAIWLPGLLAYAGWRLGLSPAATQYTRSIAYGLVVAGSFWATLRFPRQLVRAHGVVEAHCAWPENAALSLWRNLRWLTLLTVPAVALVYVFEMRGEDLWRESVGRLLFLFVLLAIAVFNYLTLRADGSLSEVLRGGSQKRPWTWRAIQVSALLVPAGLGAAALRGFYWTALQLTLRLHLTILFFFLLLVAMQLVARISLLAKRRAAREEETLEKRQVEPAPRMEVSRLMIGAGLLLAIVGGFAIWADLLPATRILNQVELWATTQSITVTELDPSGVERVSTEDQLVAITLADLFRSLLLGLLTLALIRALPGVLEATIFRRLGPGERYAYSTIVKYAVALAGVAVAFDAIGIGWSSIQWLVAAIGLGLGFGLQEIFANFVSGLIILFERPIRVGDTVSVGEISGKVTKIRIRATWITAFDRKELIVPNKAFVTGQLINWTLSDQILRTTIPVGIAYGSDTDLAIEVLTRVARESSLVLARPAPEALFLGFGDSSLSFELRVFVRTAERLFPARHALHMSIDKALREAGIEIAFPQRDLHVRSMPPGFGPSSQE